MNVWCALLGNKLIGPSVLDNNLTGNKYEVFLRNELPGLLEDILLMIRGQMYFQHDGTPPILHSARERVLNLLKPKDIYIYICRTAALTSRRYVLNIYSTNIHIEYFKHAA